MYNETSGSALSKDAPQPTNFIEALMAELHGFEAMAGSIAEDLHSQADRLFGPTPSDVAQHAPQVAANGPSLIRVTEIMTRIRAGLARADEGARRLRKIG